MTHKEASKEVMKSGNLSVKSYADVVIVHQKLWKISFGTESGSVTLASTTTPDVGVKTEIFKNFRSHCGAIGENRPRNYGESSDTFDGLVTPTRSLLEKLADRQNPRAHWRHPANLGTEEVQSSVLSLSPNK